MKLNLYILTTLIIIQISVASGQEFAPIGAEWYYSSGAGGAAPIGSEYYHLIVDKDTTINDSILRKINRTYYRYQGDSIRLAPYYIYQQEDTVFLFDKDINKYYRLLIFNANPGDTLLLDIPYIDPYFSDSTYRVVIDTVITEIYDDTELKKYVLNQIDEFGWLFGFYIEQVGGYEWFLPIGLATIPEHDGPIRCYHDNQIDINFTANDCDYRVINSLNNSHVDRFKVFPNPTYGEVHIQSDLKIDLIEIIDNSGKIILETTKTTIDIRSLDNGIYLLNIYSNKNRIIKKITKY